MVVFITVTQFHPSLGYYVVILIYVSSYVANYMTTRHHDGHGIESSIYNLHSATLFHHHHMHSAHTFTWAVTHKNVNTVLANARWNMIDWSEIDWFTIDWFTIDIQYMYDVLFISDTAIFFELNRRLNFPTFVPKCCEYFILSSPDNQASIKSQTEQKSHQTRDLLYYCTKTNTSHQPRCRSC